MWYCLMLFYCYVVYYLVETKIGTWLNLILASISIVLVSRYGSMWALYYKWHFIGGVEIPAYFYCYFVSGVLVYKYKNIVSTPKIIIPYAIIWLISGLPYISVMAYILLLYNMAILLVNSNIINQKVWMVINRIGICGFGVYVFHHMILWDISHISYLAQYTIPFLETHYIIAPIIATIFTFVLSMLMTELLIKTRVGKYLLC